MPPIFRLLLAVVTVIIILPYVLNQVRKPTKWTGRFFLWLMNRTHSSVTDWGLQHVSIGRRFTILDVGCGGGRTIQKLAAMAAEGSVYGVDYAEGSVAASRSHNAQLIQAGRIGIAQASVSQLPFCDSRFDLVTAVETQYYWPDLVKDMRQILRVLKPGGTLLVIVESYRKNGRSAVEALPIKGLKLLSVNEHREVFVRAGYAAVEIFEEHQKGWLCGIGRKPQS